MWISLICEVFPLRLPFTVQLYTNHLVHICITVQYWLEKVSVKRYKHSVKPIYYLGFISAC